MSTGERIAPPNASAGRGGVVSFAGPHARSSAQLASLSHRPHGPDVARCRTLLDFARALRTSTWDLVVVDCGPGNPRLADVVAIYRRSGTAAPLVVVSEPTPQLAPMLAGIEGWTVVGPGDADRLAELIARCCGAPGCQAGTPTPAAPQSAALAEHSVLDRPAFLQSLRHPLAAGSATGVLLLLTLDSPAEQWLLSAVVFAALDSAAAPPAAFGHLAPDLFGALVDPGPADPAAGVELAQRLRAQLLTQAKSPGAAAITAVAVAVCPARSTDTDAEVWLERAERACRDVAARSEHGYAVLSRVPIAPPSARRLPALVQDALTGNRLALVFQPIVSLRGDAREHYEALLRLPTVTAGEMLPGDFFAAAEAAGLMPAVDQWVARAAVRRLSEERGRCPRAHFFVALSAAGFRDDRVLLALCDELAATKARGDWLTVQLRATDLQQHPVEAARLVAGLRKIRCRVALDRYEHDVTAQERITALRFDFVKLHPRLTRGVADDHERLAVLGEVARWLNAAGARTVATGVEDAQTLAYLWTAGIEYAQGFFLQEPSGSISYDDAD